MIVLDCCAAVAIVQLGNEGKALWRHIPPNETIASSELLHPELCSVFRKYAKAGLLSRQDAAAYVETAASIPDVFYPTDEFRQEALRESIRLDHSPYDLFYLLIARRTGGTLLTTDKALLRLCHQEGISCYGGEDVSSV